MTDMITAQFIRELPNGDEFNYQFHITEYLEERDNFGVIFQYHFAHFMAQYTYLKDKLNKEKRMTNEQERAFEKILHSIQQAQVPGNDWRRELKLIESTCRAALQSQERPITYAGISYWVGDKRCSYGFTKDELELSTLDIIQAAFDHARRRIEEDRE